MEHTQYLWAALCLVIACVFFFSMRRSKEESQQALQLRRQQSETSEIYPLRTSQFMGLPKTLDDGWLKLESASGKSIMVGIYFRAHGVLAAEVIEGRYRLNDGTSGDLRAFFRELIADWNEVYPEALDGQAIKDSFEDSASNFIEKKFMTVVRERCPVLAKNPHFDTTFQVSFRHVENPEPVAVDTAHARA